jgi:hypothetical protein
VIETAEEYQQIANSEATVAKYAYYTLMDPTEVRRTLYTDKVNGDFWKFLDDTPSRNFINENIARMRRWREIPRDEAQEILDSSRAPSEQEARNEYLIREIMHKYSIDRQDATDTLQGSDLDTQRTMEVCRAYSANARQRQYESLRQNRLQVPSKDTRHPPDITPRTRIIAVLGVDESNQQSNLASPSLGNGWMVSDFYLSVWSSTRIDKVDKVRY